MSRLQNRKPNSNHAGFAMAVPKCKIVLAMMLINTFVPWRSSSLTGRTCFFLLFSLLLFPFETLRAQSNPPSADERVQNLYAEAKAAEAGGDLAGAIAKYESILQIAPRLGAAYNNLGSLYLKQREYRKAAAILEKGLKIDPSMTSATALLGMVLFETGDYPAARLKLEAALRANPKDNNLELVLANDLIKLGELEAATAHLQLLAHRDSNDQEVWYLLGSSYMKLAEQALSKLTEIDPDSVLVHEVSGEIMESMKNFDGALIEYKKAVEMAPKQPGTHYRLGSAYWSLSMWDAATHEFEAELANDPNNCAAEWKIGNILQEQRLDPQQALTHIDKALALCPNLMAARADRGRALLRLDRSEEAVKELQAVEKADPSDAGIHFQLAQAYRALGRTKEAQAEMQVFSKLEESARAASAQRAQQVLQNKENPPHQ
jgi:tetratricopeptide (TPR) repeat protein